MGAHIPQMARLHPGEMIMSQSAANIYNAMQKPGSVRYVPARRNDYPVMQPKVYGSTMFWPMYYGFNIVLLALVLYWILK